jgi:hypothetical protein
MNPVWTLRITHDLTEIVDPVRIGGGIAGHTDIGEGSIRVPEALHRPGREVHTDQLVAVVDAVSFGKDNIAEWQVNLGDTAVAIDEAAFIRFTSRANDNAGVVDSISARKYATIQI